MWPQTVGQAESAMSDELQLEGQLTPQQPNSSAQSSGSAREALALAIESCEGQHIASLLDLMEKH